MDSKASDSTVATIGIDIGKNMSHLIGLDKCGAIVLRPWARQLPRMLQRGPERHHQPTKLRQSRRRASPARKC